MGVFLSTKIMARLWWSWDRTARSFAVVDDVLAAVTQGGPPRLAWLPGCLASWLTFQGQCHAPKGRAASRVPQKRNQISIWAEMCVPPS